MAIGHCRLFGIEPLEDLDGTLPATQAMAASEQLREFLDAWTEDAGRLGVRWDEEEPEVGEALCAEVLEGRMDAWAAFVAIDEAYYDCKLAREPAAVEFDALDRLLDALDRFDDVLQEPDNLPLLSLLTGTQLLKIGSTCLRATIARCFPGGWMGRWRLRIGGSSGSYSFGAALESGSGLCLCRLYRAAAAIIRWLFVDKRSGDGCCGLTVAAIPLVIALGVAGWETESEFALSGSGQAGTTGGPGVRPCRYSPAAELQGESVLFAGEPSRIDENGIARFDLASLQAKLGEPGGKLVLKISDGAVNGPLAFDR